MTSPWDGPRHRSWASNTVLTLILLVVLIIATVISDALGEPPNYLVGLLGTAAGAFFTALSSDKVKRETEVRDTAVEAVEVAHRAEAKVDAAVEVAEHESPGSTQRGVDRREGGGEE